MTPTGFFTARHAQLTVKCKCRLSHLSVPSTYAAVFCAIRCERCGRVGVCQDDARLADAKFDLNEVH